MKRFCIIGIGHFGYYLARTLFEDGHEVVAIDIDQKKVQHIQDHVSYVMLADAANKEFLERQGVAEMDAVVITIGARSHISTLITLYLKELQVPRILVKAIDEDHGQILTKVGATKIIIPEKDMAVKTAMGLSRPNILDYIPLADDYVITETAPPNHFIGKNLNDLNLRKNHNVMVIAIKNVITGELYSVPPANYVIKDSDLLILISKSKNIDKIITPF